jgi:hypothetical protein
MSKSPFQVFNFKIKPKFFIVKTHKKTKSINFILILNIISINLKRKFNLNQ